MGPGGEPGLDIFWVQQAGAPDPREMSLFIGAPCWLAFVCCPPTSSSAPESPSRGPPLSQLTPRFWTPLASAGHSALAGTGLIKQGSTGWGAGGGWQGP